MLATVAHSQVLLFLVEAKRLIAEGKCKLVKRKKNLDALANLGWGEKLLFEFICSEITTEEYIDGPRPDNDFPGEDVWIFGAEVEEKEYYVKLKIRRFENDNSDLVLCISFHPADYPLKYPFKGR